jgi:hypothetical protein
VVAKNFTDLRYTGIINPNGNAAVSDTQALIARGNIASGEFYAAEVSFEDGKLIIFRNDDLAGNASDLDAVTASVPEPSSLVLAAGLLLFGGTRRRQR